MASPASVGRGARLPRTIWYMGAKARVIPGLLDGVLERLLEPGGKLLDLFSGSGIVAAFAARRQRVISNDVQEYAALIARSLIERPPGGGRAFGGQLSVERDLLASFEENRRALGKLHARRLALEDRLLAEYAAEPRGREAAALAGRYRKLLREEADGLYGGPGRPGPLAGEASIGRYRRDPRRAPACLLTTYYANVYYGLRQAIDLDSLRRAIDRVSGPEPLRERKRVHYLSALIHAASVTTSGTSHFAQPRQLTKDSELRAMAARRRIDVLSTFREYSDEIRRTVEAAELDPGNRALARDYRELIRDGARGAEWAEEARADLVYVDPPYTADNYSRFYHVLETLTRYDYPPLERLRSGRPTAGRYPEIRRRFQSRFCRPGQVEGEFLRVIAASAGSRAKLVISYGSPNGLLLKVYRARGVRDPVRALEDLCRTRYRDVRTERRPVLHSGQGDSNIPTDELVVVCERPR